MRGFLVAGLMLVFVAGNAFAQAPVTQPAAEDPLNDPYIRELVRRSRGSNELLAGSISDALRLRLDNFASDFLTSLASRNLNATELAKLTRQISPERLLRVVVEEPFTPAAKTQATKMLDALRTFEQSAERISPAIQKLSDPSPDERLAALRIVLAGGDHSIALLSVAAAMESEPAKRDEMLRVLMRLGAGGPAAVRQLAIYGNDSIRAGALSALIRLGADLAAPVIVAAIHDPNATAEERSIAEEWLTRRYPSLPSRHEAEVFLMDRLGRQREAIALVDDHEALVTLWTVGEDRASVVFTNVNAIDAAWREVIDYARLLRRVDSLSPEAVRAGVATELAYRYQLDPLMVGESSADVVAIWGEDTTTAESLNALIEDALRRNDLVVAMSAMALLDESMATQAEVLMTTHSEVLTPLVAAASHPQPRLRFHAAAAIGRLGFDQPYAGSSYVLERWIEMVGLSREPIILMLETRLEVEAQIERLLTSMGYRIEVVSSVRDAVLAVDRGGDLRYLISTTVLPDRSAIELVDAVRRRPLGGDLPILLHGPIDLGVDAAITDLRWAAPLTHVELPATAAGWSLIFEPIERVRPLPPLSAVERLDFRVAGADALGRIATKPDSFSFYEFGKLAGTALSGVSSASESSSVAFGEPILAVLSVSASRDAQSALADLAMHDSMPLDRREAAAKALLLSIERDGVLLAGNDLLRIAQTRQLMDSEMGSAIDQVLTEIGRRTDVGGITSGSVGESVVPKPIEK